MNNISLRKRDISLNAKLNDSFFRRVWKSRMLYLMFMPCVILLGVFTYYPMYGIIIAFKDFYILQGIIGSPWVGLKHINALVTSLDFSRVLGNTIILSLYRIAAGLPVPIFLALMINEMKDGFYKRITQTVSYLPHFISWIVVTSLFTQVLSPSSGIVNAIIKAMGFKPIYFMAEPSLFRHVLIFSSIWKEVGWSSILYLAVLSQVDAEITEASIIDGATRLQRIWYINLPYLLPIVSINLILSMGSVLNGNFDQIFNMANARVMDVVDIIDTYVYRLGMADFKYSFSTAVGVFKNVIGVIFVIISQLFLSWMNKHGGDREIYGLY